MPNVSVICIKLPITWPFLYTKSAGTPSCLKWLLSPAEDPENELISILILIQNNKIIFNYSHQESCKISHADILELM